MPVALDPSKRFEIVLDSDKDKPKETQPRFFCRVLSSAAWKEIINIGEQARGSTDGREIISSVFAALKMAIVDWQNMGEHAFSQNAFELILDPVEARELLGKVVSGAMLGADDAKKSVSPSPSSTASSVESVPVGDAATHPLNPPQ